jgi:hypothetical protein
MIRLVMLLLFFWIIPVISNAAGIYENAEDSPMKLQKINAPSPSDDENVSVYETELVLILQKHHLIQKVQENKDTMSTQYGIEDKNSSFIETIIFNNDVDARVLLETEATWKEIKNKVDYLNIFFNKIDMWAEDFLANNIDTNLILISDNNEIKRAKKVKNLRNKHTEKHDSLLTLNKVNHSNSSGSSAGTGSGVSASGSKEKIDYGKNTFNLLYIWEKYSDIIIGVLVVIGLWSVVRSLIHITSR